MELQVPLSLFYCYFLVNPLAQAPFWPFVFMDESKIHDNDRIANGDNGDECSGFECKSNVTSQRLIDVLKCSLLKLAIDGADKVFKDQKLLNSKRCFAENGEGWSSSSENYRVYDTSISEEEGRDKVNCMFQENERVCAKPDYYSSLESSNDHFGGTSAWNNQYVNVSKVVNSPSGAYSEFPLNLLALLAILVMKIIGFQLSLLVSFFTFPIWFSYFSFMFLMFPFETLRHIRGYLMKKLLRMFGATRTSVTSFVSERLDVQNSVVNVAMRFGWALFWSIYVCFMLFGLLASGFVLGSFMMQRVVEKPIRTAETLNFDYTKASPVAFVPVMSYPTVDSYSSLISNDNAEAGRKHVRARVIPHNHKLQLTVSLTVPESEYNLKLGVFQVRVEFLSANGKVTASSSYPCMLRFKSQSIRLVETILRSAPLIAGFQSESQMLNIKMNEFTEGLEPTACLKVILEQRAQHQPGAGIPEIYAASLMLETELPQLKKIIWYWRRTILVWASIMSFLTELVFVLVFCRPIIIPRGRPRIAYGKKEAAS